MAYDADLVRSLPTCNLQNGSLLHSCAQCINRCLSSFDTSARKFCVPDLYPSTLLTSAAVLASTYRSKEKGMVADHVWWRDIRHDGRNFTMRTYPHRECTQHHTTDGGHTANLVQAGINGAQQAGSWAVRETFVAVVIGNLPMIHPLFASTITRIGSSFSVSRASRPSDGSRSISLKALSRKPRTANPLSVSSSAEQIIEARFKKQGNAASRQDRDENVRGIQVISQTTVDSGERGGIDGHDMAGGHSQCVISA